MILTNLLLFIAGIVTLLIGGEFLIRGSSRLAKSLGIDPIIIGLTIIAFGTSSPEFIVGLIAAIKGSSDIAVGNIVGSNISNIGLILGATAVITSIFVNNRILKIKLPILLLFTGFFILLSLNNYLSRLDGIILFFSLIVFIIYNYSLSKKYKKFKEDIEETDINNYKQIGLIVFGITGLALGAHLLVDKSIFFARLAGVSELVIGITAVAIGTSLPELTASIFAAVKKEHELILGNIIGSNIFNVGILGLIALIKPIGINPEMFKIEFPALVVFTLLLLPFMKTGAKINRFYGILFLIIYSVFIYILFI